MGLTPRQRTKAKLAAKTARLSTVAALTDWAKDRQLWEQQPKEGSSAYAHFSIYRDMEPTERTFTAAARKLGMTGSGINTIAIAGRWKERAAAWDNYLDRARLAQTEIYQLEMAARHAEIAKMMLERVRDRLSQINFKQLEPKVVSQWLDIGVKVERLSRGLTADATTTNVNSINVNLRQMSESELLAEIERETKRLTAGRGSVIEIPVSESPVTS